MLLCSSFYFLLALYFGIQLNINVIFAFYFFFDGGSLLMVLGLTVLIVGRIVVGLIRTWRNITDR
ncbi:MAG: hypothetical protein ACFFEY_12185 [Candidatus Thorarchaeota archaeon]